jgi:hypothetical protein
VSEPESIHLSASSAGGAPAGRAAPVSDWLARRSDASLVLLLAVWLFAMAAWPLLLVDLPPFQDLPNHVATAHIIAHPDLYPEFVGNGFLKSNSLLALWLHVAGGLGLFGAARAFTALVLAVTALALPLFVLRFAGRRAVPVAMLLVWPLVHGFFVSMGMLNFALGFALSLVLLVLVDGQRERPSLGRASVTAGVACLVWYAHPFPLAIVGILVAIHAASRANWPQRLAAARSLLVPLVPAGLLSLLAAERHLLKSAPGVAAAGPRFSYLNPLEILGHFWTDASGALTFWGSMTIVPALLLPWYAWRHRREPRALFTRPALAALLAAYVATPVMLSNWWYFNCRFVPFLWVGLALRLPNRLPRALAALLLASALAFSVVTGIDYRRLDGDRAAFTAGLGAVPERATLLPLMFRQERTSDFTASLAHAWGFYAIAKNTSAPLVFAAERSYPITYREFPPRALIAPALDRLAELAGTPAQVCGKLGQPPDEAGCVGAWRALWRGFWRQAEPRFSHVLTWGMPPEARGMVPECYKPVFREGDLEIFERLMPAGDVPGKGAPPL